MKISIIKTFSIILSAVLVVSCGGGKEEEEFKFYALKEAASQQLELTVEAVSYTHLTLPTILRV